MEKYANQDVYYSRDFFDEATLEILLSRGKKGKKASLDITEQPQEKIEVSSEKDDFASIFPSVWDEIKTDPEISDLLKQSKLEKEEAFEAFKQMVSADLTDSVVKELDKIYSGVLKRDYCVSYKDGYYMHTLNQSPILSIGGDFKDAETTSIEAEKAILWAFVILDMIFLICAAIGIRLSETLRKTPPAILIQEGRRLLTGTSEAIRAAKILPPVDKVLKIVGIMRGFKGTIKDVIKDLFSEMTFWEKARAIVNFMASVALLAVSGGASLSARIVSFGASLACFVNDIVRLYNALALEGSVYPNVPVRLKSQWNGTCINIEKGEREIEATDDVKPEWQSAKWIFQPVPGKDNTYRIKNVWKNLYLHIENIEKGKNLECGEIKDKWLSAQWLIQDLHGNLRIRNAWKDNIYINNEDAPKVKATAIKDVWESAKWIVQKVE